MDQNKQKVIDALNELIKLDEEHRSNYVTVLSQMEFTARSVSVYLACSGFMYIIKMRTIDQKIISLIDIVIDYLDAIITVLELTGQGKLGFTAVAPTNAISYIGRGSYHDVSLNFSIEQFQKYREENSFSNFLKRINPDRTRN